MSQNWRTEVNSEDYFRARDKRLSTEERRPSIRNSTDLVGPGIGSSSVRVTDWNDVLALFNGYYSSEPGANSAPSADEPFTGFTVMDSELGGTQTLTGLVSGNEYSRVFTRNPSDPSTVGFGYWHTVTEAASIARLDGPGYIPGGTWHLMAETVNDTVRGKGIEVVQGGVLRVLRDGWYQVGAQVTFAEGVDQMIMRVTSGKTIITESTLIACGGVDAWNVGVPLLNGSTVAYLTARTQVCLFVFLSDAASLEASSLYVMET